MKTLEYKANKNAELKLPDIPLTFVLFILVCILCLDLPHMAALMLCAAVHEFGHLFVLFLLDGRGIVLKPGIFGLEIGYEPLSLSPMRQCIAALGGPVAGAILAVLLRFSGNEMWQYTGRLSMALSVFNLLPLSLLDGGVVCSNALQCIFDSVRADRMSIVLDALVLSLLIGAALFQALHQSRWFEIILPICLTVTYCGKEPNGV